MPLTNSTGQITTINLHLLVTSKKNGGMFGPSRKVISMHFVLVLQQRNQELKVITFDKLTLKCKKLQNHQYSLQNL